MSSANQLLPAATVAELAPGAAFAPAGVDEVVVFMGPAGGGPLNSPRAISAQDIATLTSTFKNGPTVKAAARFLAKIGKPIVFCRLATATVEGTKSSVTVNRDPSGAPPTNTITGTPTNGGDVSILYTVGGTTGVSGVKYKVSTNGGDEYGDEQDLGTATSITVLGVTLTLGGGKAITAGDTTSWLQTVASSTVLPTTQTGTGSSVITVSGTPLDKYEVAVEFPVGGTIGTAGVKFRYTLDAGAPDPVWSAVISLGTATSYALLDGPLSTEPTGLTLHFAAGDIDANDTFSFGTSSPAYDAAGVTAGLGTPTTGLLGWNGTWTWVRLIGPVTAALAGTISGILEGFAGYNHPTWGVADYRDRAGNETNAAHSLHFQHDFAAYTSTHCGISFGLTRYTDPVNGRSNRRPVMDVLVARAQAYDIDVNWGQTALGPLTADVIITDADGNIVEHNANTDNGPNSMGAITLRTWPGQPGVWPTQAALMGPDSDIKLVPLRRVMNRAKLIQYQIQQLQILQDPQVYQAGDRRGTPGNLVEAYARMVERVGRKLLNDGLGTLVSGFTFNVNRTPISLGGGNYKVTFTLKINPRIYIVLADGTAQFTSPTLDVINQTAA